MIKFPKRLTIEFEFFQPFSFYLVVYDKLPIGFLYKFLTICIDLISKIKISTVCDDTFKFVCFNRGKHFLEPSFLVRTYNKVCIKSIFVVFDFDVAGEVCRSRAFHHAVELDFREGHCFDDLLCVWESDSNHALFGADELPESGAGLKTKVAVDERGFLLFRIKDLEGGNRGVVRDLFDDDFIVSETSLESFSQNRVEGLFHLWLSVHCCNHPTNHKFESFHVVFQQKSLV